MPNGFIASSEASFLHGVSFLYVKAKIFVASGECIVIAIAFAVKAKFSTVKNIFDITLVIISSIISIWAFGVLQGVGVGTIAAAILIGRWVKLYNTFSQHSINFHNKLS